MKVAVICIGDELLRGSTINTNLAFIGETLMEEGIKITFSIEVPDKKEEILEALEVAMEKADIIITSGGLGPTADDVTKEFVAQRVGLRLIQNGEAAVAIMKYWKTLHLGEMPPRIMNQSLVPEGAEVLHNKCGTAPGLVMRTGDSDKFPGRTLILLPGPPSELQPMFMEYVVKLLKARRKTIIHTKLFRISGIGESMIEERMLPIIASCHPLSVAYCASPELVKLFLNSENSEVLGHAIREVRKIFRKELLSDTSETLAEEVLAILEERGETLASAESCTGGLVAKLLTDVPGCSKVFKGSVVAYSNEIKENILGVSSGTLSKYGAVSAECAEELVKGVAERLGTNVAIATTGIAGPDGGTPEKPVGMVFIAVKYQNKIIVKELILRRSRSQIRERAAAKALNLLRQMALGFPTD